MVIARRFGPMSVLLVSGLVGFVIGAAKFPTWQVAVESAQVVAGIVKYPANNPFYIYHVKVWTILHQLCAVLLLAGRSEIWISIALSGVLGMVSFQAMAMIAYALSQDALLALAMPFFIVTTGIAEHGVVYPVFLMGTQHTYGSIGLSIIVLAAGLIGAGCYRLGWMLVGLAPAVHPSLGACLWLTAAVALMVDSQHRRELMNRAWRWFAGGAGLAALSALIHLTVTYNVPHVDRQVTAPYVRAFIGFWDSHRGGAILYSVGVAMNAGAIMAASLWLAAFPKRLSPSAMFLLRLILITGVLSLAFVLVSWIPASRVPLPLTVLIPARLLNFNVVIYSALLAGLLATCRQRLWAQILTAILVGGPLLSGNAAAVCLLVVTAGLLLFGAVTKWRTRIFAPRGVGVTDRSSLEPRMAKMVRLAALTAFGWAVVRLALSPGIPNLFADRTNDPVFAAAAAETRGLVVTSGSFHLVQLYTRRPVLLDSGGLDALPYAPESGPEMNRILRDVYGIDLFHPPIEARGGGVVPHVVNKAIWDTYSRERWREIRQQYNVTQVIAREDYALDLPVVAENSSVRLYRIPE